VPIGQQDGDVGLGIPDHLDGALPHHLAAPAFDADGPGVAVLGWIQLLDAKDPGLVAAFAGTALEVGPAFVRKVVVDDQVAQKPRVVSIEVGVHRLRGSLSFGVVEEGDGDTSTGSAQALLRLGSGSRRSWKSRTCMWVR